MTIKQRFNIRVERIKDWMATVRAYRDAKQNLYQAERYITSDVNANEVEDTFACIKNYVITAPATNVFDIGENVYPQSKFCHRFNHKPCPILNCPFYEQNLQYNEAVSLLNQARDVKHAARKRIFERIK